MGKTANIIDFSKEQQRKTRIPLPPRKSSSLKL